MQHMLAMGIGINVNWIEQFLSARFILLLFQKLTQNSDLIHNFSDSVRKATIIQQKVGHFFPLKS